MDIEFCDMCNLKVSVDKFEDEAGVYHYECFDDWVRAEAARHSRGFVSTDDYSGYDRNDYKNPERVERVVELADGFRG